jgi:hypothetical protein
MNILKTRAFALTFAVFFISASNLRAQVKPDTALFKTIKALSAKILKNDLPGTAMSKLGPDSVAIKKKITSLQVTLNKINAATKADAAFEKALKGLRSLSIDSVATNALPNFNNDFSQLKKLSKTFSATSAKPVSQAKPLAPGTPTSTKNNTAAAKPGTPPPTVAKKDTAVKPSQAGVHPGTPDKNKEVISTLKNEIAAKDRAIVAKDTIIESYKTIAEGYKNDLLYFKVALAAVILAFILLIATFFKIKAKNKKLSVGHTALETAFNELKQRYYDLDLTHQQLNSANQNLVKTITPKEQYKVVDHTQPTHVHWMTDVPIAGKYFFGEAMVTAGPRKNFDTDASEGDYGLGEDVAGLIIRKDKAFFWVLDGTSDSDRLVKPLLTADSKHEEYFSSRLLAQAIGWNLQSLIGDGLPAEFNATRLLQEAIKITEREWKHRIGRLDKASQDALMEILADKNGVLQCSTTAVFGVLCLDGRLDICRIGDTKIIAYPGDNNFAKSTGRQFVTLQQKEEEINLSFNDFTDVRSQIIQLTNINTLLVMTDGISNQMENWLKNSPGVNFSEKSTREIFARFNQNTYDDKAMCIIQIK